MEEGERERERRMEREEERQGGGMGRMQGRRLQQFPLCVWWVEWRETK